MTIRSRIRPGVYKIVELSLVCAFYILIGSGLFVIIVALSFFWIPLAIWLWFEEKPVVDGIKKWFENDVFRNGGSKCQ